MRAAYGSSRSLGYAWPEGAHLRVRVAVHTGEAVETDGDYVGTTVNRGAACANCGRRRRGDRELRHRVACGRPSALGHIPQGARADSAARILERAERACCGAGLVVLHRGARGDATVDVLAEAGVTRRERERCWVRSASGSRTPRSPRFCRCRNACREPCLGLAPTWVRPTGWNSPRSDTCRRQLERSCLRDSHRTERAASKRRGAPGRPPSASGLRREQTVLALVTGEVGIGKTRVAAELAVEVHRRGGEVRPLGVLQMDGAQMAYQPSSTCCQISSRPLLPGESAPKRPVPPRAHVAAPVPRPGGLRPDAS